MPTPPLTKRWNVPPAIDTESDCELQAYPRFMRQILFNRGIRTAAEADLYLNATQPLADPFLLQDMEKAIDRLLVAVDRQEPIAVYGDYDVDGVSATVLMVEVLQAFGAIVTRYIPNRFDEGYGLNNDGIQILADSGVKIILSVDCGIRSPMEAEFARSLDVDLIISDHHHPKHELPDAYAVICPKREDDSYPDKDLAGVGVAYKIAQGLFARRTVNALDADNWLDLVALGTVADVVPLTGENRVMVRRGIVQIRLGQRVGLNALAGAAGRSIQNTSATDIGYILGPRLNAAGRMTSAIQAYEMLISDSIQNVGYTAQVLEDQNSDRQRDTKIAQESAQVKIVDSAANILIVYDEAYSPGIVGLVASKLVENYYRPAVVGHIEEGFVRASCRSIAEFHITEALDECAELLVRHGGHAAAAGFTVKMENVEPLIARLTEIADRELGGKDLRHRLDADVELGLDEITPTIYRELEQLQPTGMGNPSALFVLRDAIISDMRTMGKEGTHIRFTIKGSPINEAVAFNQAYWYEVWRADRPKFDIAFTFDVNRYFGRETLQLSIKDMKVTGMPD